MHTAKVIFGKYRIRVGGYQLLEKRKGGEDYILSSEVKDIHQMINMGMIPPLEYLKLYKFLLDCKEQETQVQ